MRNVFYTFCIKSMSGTPFYKLNDFINACSDERRVTVTRSVLEDAQRLFNLRSKKQILDAIYSENVEINDLVNSRELEKNKYKDKTGATIPVYVDAYYFTYTGEEGYLAFYLTPLPPNKWLLKSFHEPQKDSLTHFGDCFDPKLIESLKQFFNKGN